MLRSTDRADRRDPLSQSTRLQAVDWDCGGHNPMLVTVVDVVAVFSVYVLPVCLNVVFLCLPRSLTAALFRSLCYARGLGKIISHPAGHSVVTGFQATKKAGTQMRTNFPQKDRLIPAVWLHIHVTGFEIQSRNCPLRFALCRQSKAVSKAAAFSLACRRHCPAYCRFFHNL